MSVTDRSFWTTSAALGLVRAGVAAPFDLMATTEILTRKNTVQAAAEITRPLLWRTFQPNFFKFQLRTPAEFVFVKAASSVVPTHLDAGVRGVAIGVLTGGMETVYINALNSIRTRFIQGAGVEVLRERSVLTNGFVFAAVHRTASWVIFLTIYEKLKAKYPGHQDAVSSVSGVAQVVLTAPFYIAAIEKQRKDAVKENPYQTMLRLWRTGRFVMPALAPRLLHSLLITPLVTRAMEKFNLIHRRV